MLGGFLHEQVTADLTEGVFEVLPPGRLRTTLRVHSRSIFVLSQPRVDQTGANAHGGGVSAGFRRLGYQVFVENAVNHELTAPGAKQIATSTTQPIQFLDI